MTKSVACDIIKRRVKKKGPAFGWRVMCLMGRGAGYLGVAQLVARYLGVVEAAGSSPVTQTRETQDNMRGLRIVLCFIFVRENVCTNIIRTFSRNKQKKSVPKNTLN